MTIAPVKPETVQKITLEQWQERAVTWKKATKELIILWFVNDLGPQKQLADYLSLSPQAVSARKSKLIESGELTGIVMSKTHPKKKDTKTVSPVENSDSKIEEVRVVVDEPAASSNAIEQSSNSNAIEQSAEQKETKPSIKRPKELASMIDAQQRYIKTRLLPIAQKLAALHEEVLREQKRLHGAWTKENLVFTEPFQRCVKYWDETEYFDDFAEALGSPEVKTYAEVLAAIRIMFRRCSERMESIEYSTGCVPDPNKRDLRMTAV